MKKSLSMLAGLLALATLPAADAADVAILLTKDIAPIANQQGQVLTVSYAPGEASAPHMHNANVFVYVLEGAVTMQVQGGAEVTVKAGDTFYEAPTDVHMVSRNASASEPAKFLVFFVKPADTPVSVPVPEAAQ